MVLVMDTKETVVKELERSTRQFVEYMKEYASRPCHTPIASDQWNVSQVVEHVILSDHSITNLLQKPFLKSKNGHYTKYRVRDLLLNRHDKIKNRENLTPPDEPEKSIPELLDVFTRQRQELIDLVQNDEIDLQSEDAFPHQSIGLLTRRDWLFLICFHSDRHIAQTQELLFVC